MERATEVSRQSSPIIWKVLSVVWLAVIVLLSSRENMGHTTLLGIWKNIVEGLSFLVLAFLWAKASKRPNLAWVCATWCAALNEVYQSFGPIKSAEFMDWFFALWGGFIGSRLAYQFDRHKSNAYKNPLEPVE
jgi:VanZ family protein